MMSIGCLTRPPKICCIKLGEEYHEEAFGPSREEVDMSPDLKAIVRRSTRERPLVRATAASVRQLQESMRRLGVDEVTITKAGAAVKTTDGRVR